MKSDILDYLLEIYFFKYSVSMKIINIKTIKLI